MKKIHVTLILFFCLSFISRAQKNDFFITPSIQVPLGDFSTSHWLGLGVELSSINYKCDTGRQRKVSFTYRAGVAYYFAGQLKKVSGFGYDYPSYYYGHFMGGVLLRPVKGVNIMATVGPAVSKYKKITRFNIISALDLSYFVHCNLSVGPGIVMIKESGADPLYALALKLNFRIH